MDFCHKGVRNMSMISFEGNSSKKVKQFKASTEEELEKLINEFLEKHTLVHIDWFLEGETKRATIVYR